MRTPCEMVCFAPRVVRLPKPVKTNESIKTLRVEVEAPSPRSTPKSLAGDKSKLLHRTSKHVGQILCTDGTLSLVLRVPIVVTISNSFAQRHIRFLSSRVQRRQ